MQIDWITVVAQILNFLVLVWILNRLLYRPVSRALAERRRTIAERLDNAEKARSDAEEEKERLEAERQELEGKRDDLMAQAREDAEEERSRLTRQARDEIAERRESWIGDLRAEQADFIARLRSRAAAAFAELARRALADLADADLSDRVATVFARRLEGADDETREALAEAARRADEAPRLIAAAEPSEDVAQRLRDAAARIFGDDTQLTFETDPDLACGVVLEAGSRRVSWTLDSYLDALDSEISEALAALGERGATDGQQTGERQTGAKEDEAAC